MCCRGERCFRISCHCQCCRCRACSDCNSSSWRKGGLGLKLAHHSGGLGKVAGTIVKSKSKMDVPPPLPNVPPPLYEPRQPNCTQGRTMITQVGKECVIQ